MEFALVVFSTVLMVVLAIAFLILIFFAIFSRDVPSPPVLPAPRRNDIRPSYRRRYRRALSKIKQKSINWSQEGF